MSDGATPPGAGYGRIRSGIRRWPLRARIIAVLAGLLGAAMFIVGMAVSWQLQAYMIQREDADLKAAAPTLIRSTIAQEAASHHSVTKMIPSNVYAVRLVDSTHTRDYFPNKGPRPDFDAVTPSSVTAHRGAPYTIGSIDDPDSQWRVIEGTDATTKRPYAVAISLANVRTVVAQMQILTLAVSTFALLTAIAIALFAVRRALRPLHDIEDTAAAIAAGDLTRRVPTPATGDEIESLSDSLNSMLAQIERSMVVKDRSEESMRRFVADASHELRTPLATVRGYAELYRHGAVTDPEDVAAGYRRIEDEAKRMSGMVDDLLLLSRLETEQRAATIGTASPVGAPRHPVDLTVLAADAVSDAEARAAENGSHRFVVRGLDGPLGPVETLGDEQRLRQVITNIIANAERYTPAETLIEVRTGVRDGDAVIAVVDHGPGIPEEMREQIFERFFRADAARTRSSGGSGLGLSIVAAIVASHDGAISVDETDGGGVTFTVRLPGAASDG